MEKTETETCFFGPVQNGVKILAWIFILFDILEIITVTLAVFGVSGRIREIDDLVTTFVSAVLIITLILVTIDLLMNIILWIGATAGETNKCNWWLIYSAILLFLSVPQLLLLIFFRLSWLNMITLIGFIIFRGYTMSVVGSLIDDIKKNPQLYHPQNLDPQTLDNPENIKEITVDINE